MNEVKPGVVEGDDAGRPCFDVIHVTLKKIEARRPGAINSYGSPLRGRGGTWRGRKRGEGGEEKRGGGV